MTHEWLIGDIVESAIYSYGASILYRIETLYARRNFNPNSGTRSVRLKVIWKRSKGTAPLWPIGSMVTTSDSYIYPPTNEMLALALYAEPSTQLGE